MNMNLNTRPMVGQPRPDIPTPLPPKTTPTDKQSAPSLCQVIAMVMCYRRLGFVFLVVPAIFGLGPVFFNAMLVLLDKLTSGYGVPCLVMVSFSVMTWTQILKATSPSPEKYEEAYRKSQVILPLLTLTFFSCIFHFIIAPTIGPDATKQQIPNVPWNIGFRPALATLLINAAILFRFVGPSSVIRCSTVPLSSNEFINSCRPQNGFLQDITAPSNPGDLLTRSLGRRHQSYSFPCFLANTAATIIAAFLLAEYVFESSGPMMDFTCVSTMAIHLWISNFDCTRHELNPKHYINHHVGGGYYPILLSPRSVKDIVKRVLFTTAGIGVIGVGCIGAWNKYRSASLISSKDWPMILQCFAVSVTLGLYAAGVEEAARASLFVASGLQRFVREVTSGQDSKTGSPSILTLEEEETYVVDVALYSLLHGDRQCLEQIGETSAKNNPNYVQIESYETERGKNASILMANVLLGKKGTKRVAEALLEEDVLRLCFLESLGGSPPVSITPTTTKGKESTEIVVRTDIETYKMDQRHRKNIEYWLKPANKSIGLVRTQITDPSISEPKVILLTRALTAYASGLGMALTECSQSRLHSLSWVLRPGALVAAEYSATALSRIFQIYFEHVKKTAADWRRGQLSTLIPATLNGLFRLHCGILDYANYLKRLEGPDPRVQVAAARTSAVVDMSENFAKDHPDLQQVLHASQEAAKKIVRQLGHAYNTMATKNAIEPYCQRWIDRMMAPIREG